MSKKKQISCFSMLPTLTSLCKKGTSSARTALGAHFSNQPEKKCNKDFTVLIKKPSAKSNLTESQQEIPTPNMAHEVNIAEKQKKEEEESLDIKKALSHPLVCSYDSSRQRYVAHGCLSGSHFDPKNNYQLAPKKFSGEVTENGQNVVGFEKPKVLDDRFIPDSRLTQLLHDTNNWLAIYDEIEKRRIMAEQRALLAEEKKKQAPTPRPLTKKQKSVLEDDNARRAKIAADEKKRLAIVKENERKTNIKDDRDDTI